MESAQNSLNLLPFVIEALGNNKRIYKDIDKLYQEHKYEFYKAAKESDLYNHPMIKSGSLVQEEYCKKILGIILGAGKDESTNREIKNLIKKGYRYSWAYLQNHTKLELEKFIRAFTKKYKGVFDENNAPIEFHVVILLYVAFNSNIEIIHNDAYNNLLNDLAFSWQFYEDTTADRIRLNRASNIDKEKIKQLKSSIYRKYGEIRNFDDLLMGRYEQKYLDMTCFLFDYENLSSVSIFEDIEFADKDIDEILYLYIISNGKLRNIQEDKGEESEENHIYEIAGAIDEEMIEDATKFLISHMYTKYLVKAYKKVKEMYFENNKETMFVELEGLERSLNSTTEKLFLVKQDVAKLQEVNSLLEKENARLKEELEQEKKNREELNSLREFLFSIDNQEEYAEREFNPEVLKDYKAVMVGGHEKWQQRMKELLPNFIFIHPDNSNFDINLLSGVDIVFIYTNYLNHGIYYKIMSAIERKNIKVAYINQQNEDKVLQKIYVIMKGDL